MYRQSPSRNQRSRGVKAKHILQICLLLAICFWLIYQVKHSHNKRKEFDESDGRILVQGESGDDLIKLGRKDIQARMEGTVSKNKKHEESEEEEEEEEEGGREDVEENKIEEDGREDVEENKIEEDGREYVEENKIEEDEMESKKVEGGDDEMDEHELEKFHEEVDGEEDLVVEENGKEGVENGSRETDLEDARGEVTEKELSVVEGNHDGDDSSSVDEAREEHYKADDASSAVTHDAQRNENQRSETPKEILGDIEMVRGEMAGDDLGSNMLNSSGNGSLPISTATEELDANRSTPMVNQNVTESKPELHHSSDILTSGFRSNTSNPVVISSHLDSNSIHSPVEESYNNKTESSEVVGAKKKNEIDENLETRNRDDEQDAIDISDTANFSDVNLHEGSNGEDVARE